MKIKNKILIIKTINIKLVPHLLWNLELSLTFSTVNIFPFSIQLIHLCSAPWYINVLLMSFINDINSIYPIKITILAIPSITGTCLLPIPGTNLSNISAINNGNIININTENIIETATTHPIITFSAFSPNLLISHNSNLPGSSSVSSSSSKKDAEYVLFQALGNQ